MWIHTHRAAERAGQKREERQQDFVPLEEEEGAASAGGKKKKGKADKGGEGKKSLRELSMGVLGKAKQQGEKKRKEGQGFLHESRGAAGEAAQQQQPLKKKQKQKKE